MKTSASEEKPTIYVNTLGGFSIKVGDKEITDNSNQSKKPWCLLEYLVVFQKKVLHLKNLHGKTNISPVFAMKLSGTKVHKTYKIIIFFSEDPE